MNSKRAKKLFSKYLDNKCSSEELELLETFLLSYQEGKTSLSNYNQEDVKVSQDELWKKILSQIEEKPTKSKSYPFNRYLYFGVAASAVIFFAINIFNHYDKKQTESQKLVVSELPIGIGSDKAILTLSDGSVIALEKGKKYEGQSVISNGESVTYQNDLKDSNESEITYNYLTIPRGGQFFVKLSDGTEIWLNSETQLKYPVRFLKGKPRLVELVYGEAYFNVSSSSSPEKIPFRVISNGQNIEVLGTEFNVKSYDSDSETLTTLVEGKIEIKSSNNRFILKPNQQSMLNKSSDLITVKTVNASQEVSWIKGLYTFEKASLGEIMRTLSRWYDFEVIFTNSKQENYVFTGVLERSQSIQDLLKKIEATGEIHFDIKDALIIVE